MFTLLLTLIGSNGGIITSLRSSFSTIVQKRTDLLAADVLFLTLIFFFAYQLSADTAYYSVMGYIMYDILVLLNKALSHFVNDSRNQTWYRKAIKTTDPMIEYKGKLRKYVIRIS